MREEEFQKIIRRLRANDSTLTELRLESNGISGDQAVELAEALKKNTHVTYVDLGWNNIGAVGATAIGDGLKTNTSVHTLDLENNNIGDVGATAIGDGLKTNTSVHTLNGIDLNKYTKELNIPVEFSDKNNADILKYLREQNKSSTVEVRRMKVIFLGAGRVGKTTLVKRMVTGLFNSNEPMTDGIFMQEWLEPESQIQFSLWDFGGQEIYLNTHRLFFSDRTVFVVMWDARIGNEKTAIPHLHAVHSFHPEASVLLVSSHSTEAALRGDSVDSLSKYHPYIKGYYPIDSKDGTGVSELTKALVSYSLQQDHVCQSLPSSYVRLEDKIRSLRSRHFSISVNDFRSYVKTEGLDETNTSLILDLFHSWGVIHNLPGHNSDIVLNPQDLADVFRCVVTASASRPGQAVYRDGILPHEHLKEIWGCGKNNYEEHLWPQLLELLHMCNLAFPLHDAKGFPLKKSLIPAMLNSLKVSGSSSNEQSIYKSCASCLNLKQRPEIEDLFSIYLKFEFLPSHFFSRLLVSLRSLLLTGGTWSNSCLLYSDASNETTNNMVLVHEDAKRQLLRIIPLNDDDGILCSTVVTAIFSVKKQLFAGSTIEKVKITQNDDDLKNEKELREIFNNGRDHKISIGNCTFQVDCLIPLLDGLNITAPSVRINFISSTKSVLFQGELKELLYHVTGFQDAKLKSQARLDLQKVVLKHKSKLNDALHGVTEGPNTFWLPFAENSKVIVVALSVNRNPNLPWIKVTDTKISLQLSTEVKPSGYYNDFDLIILKDLFRILCFPTLAVDQVFDVIVLPKQSSDKLKSLGQEMVRQEAIHFSEAEESSIFDTADTVVFANIISKSMKDAESAFVDILKSQVHIKHSIASINQYNRLLLQNFIGIPRVFLLIPINLSDKNRSLSSKIKGFFRFFTMKFKMFFVCPVSGIFCNTNDGKGYKLNLPKEWAQKYGPAIKFSLTICSALLGLGANYLDIPNPLEPLREEISKALDPTELAQFLKEIDALTPKSNSNPTVVRDEAYRLLSAEVMKIDPSLSRCGCKWVVSDELGEDTYATWVSPEKEDQFKREGKRALLPKIREELFK